MKKKGFSFEKFGLQKFPSRPKPTWSGHGYSFQLAKTHCEDVSVRLWMEVEDGELTSRTNPLELEVSMRRYVEEWKVDVPLICYKRVSRGLQELLSEIRTVKPMH